MGCITNTLFYRNNLNHNHPYHTLPKSAGDDALK